MHRTFTVIALLIILTDNLLAQPLPLGNEWDATRWINYQQTYYKIPVARNGLYRLTTAELQQAGVQINAIEPATIQLFHRGVEQAIYVTGETNKRLHADDFIEFYGRGNDGTQDSLLYQPGTQPHRYYSLFSDTTAYFLTWRLDGKPGKRMTAYADTTFTGLTPEPYHWTEELRLFPDTYSVGNIYPIGANLNNGAILTNYDVGEGWSSAIIKMGGRYDQEFSLLNLIETAGASPQVSYLLVGRNPWPHRVDYLAGPSATDMRTIGKGNFENYNTQSFVENLTAADISQTGNVVLSITPKAENDQVSVAYMKLRYPQRTDLGGNLRKLFHLCPNTVGRSYLDLANVPPETRLFDISDPTNVIVVDGRRGNNRWQGVVRNSQSARTLYVTSQVLTVPSIHPVAFRNIDPKLHNYLIITHPLLRKPASGETDPVEAYAIYRASEAGGHYDTLTVNIDQLFDQFSYGERHPLAIRRFADFMLRGGGSRPKFLFLIGQSRDPQSVRKNPNAELLDMVPNAGWPGSDLGLVAGLNGEPANVPAMPIGRLNSSRSQSVLDYLNKVKEHEDTVMPALWRKDVLHLSGGTNTYELNTFRDYVDEFKSVVENRYVGAQVTTVSKQTDNPVEVVPIIDQINKGVGMISMFGHSSLDVSDIDIGFVSNDRLGYRNKGRYPFLLANGCAAGNFYFGRPTFGSDWILTPDRGAVLFMAHTYNGFASTLKHYSDQLYSLLADSNYVAKPISLLQQEAIRRYLKLNTSIYDITNAQQITLQGDPAVSVFPFPKPDFAFAPSGLTLTDSKGDSLTAKADSVVISGVVVNYGRVTNSTLTIRVRRFDANGQLLREQRFRQPAPYYADTVQLQFPNDVITLGTSYFELLLDPDKQIVESNEQNNSIQLNATGQATALPFPADLTPPLIEVAFDGRRIYDGDLVSPRPVIDVLLQDENTRLIRTDTAGLELYLQRPCANEPCPYERLSLADSTVHWTAAGLNNDFRLSYQPATPLSDGRYTFQAIGHDLSGNRAAPYQIYFTVKSQPELSALAVYPNPFSQLTRFTFTLTGPISPSNVTIRINDLAGRTVRVLHQPVRVGVNEWFWDGTSDAGNALPAGLYVYIINGTDLPTATGGVSLNGRIVLYR